MTATLAPSQRVLNPQLHIAGRRRLSGELRVSGAKNSALVLMAASLLTEDQMRLRNVPPLTDIQGMGDILSAPIVTALRAGEQPAGQLLLHRPTAGPARHRPGTTPRWLPNRHPPRG